MDHLSVDQMKKLFRGELSPYHAKEAEDHLSQCILCDEQYESVMRLYAKKENQTAENKEQYGTVYLDALGRNLACNVCDYDVFVTKEIETNSIPIKLKSLKVSTCYVCKRCSHLHWFA